MSKSNHIVLPLIITAFEFAIAVAVSLFIISSVTQNYLQLPFILSATILSVLCIPICLLLYRSEDDQALLDTFSGLIALFIIQTLSGIIWYIVPSLTDHPSIAIFGMSLMATGYLPIIIALYRVLKRQKIRIEKPVLAAGAVLSLAGAAALFFAVPAISGNIEVAFTSLLLYITILCDLFIVVIAVMLVAHNRNNRRKYIFAILGLVFLMSLAGDLLSEIATIGLYDTMNMAQFAYAVMLLFLTTAMLLYSLTRVNLVVLSRVRRELKDTRRLVGDLLLHTPDAMGITDAQGNLDLANENFLTLLNECSFMGERFNIFRDGNLFGPEIGNQMKDLLLGKTAVVRNVRYDLAGDGNERFLSFKMFPTYSSDEGVSGYAIIIDDVTEQMQAEEKLRASEEKLSNIFASSPDSITLIDTNGIVIECNQATAKMHGYPDKEALIGTSAYELIAPYDFTKAEDAMKDVILNGLKKACEITLRDISGKEFPAEVSASALRDRSGQPVALVAITKDITERKHAFEAIRKAHDDLEIRVVERTTDLMKSNTALHAEINERKRIQQILEKEQLDLKRSNEELEQFAYIASHDLQEPLRMVNSYVKLIEKRYKGKLDSDADDYIQYAVDGTTRMQMMIADMLQYSLVGTKSQLFEQVDMERAFLKVQNSLSAAIEESNATVTHTPLPTVLGDSMQIMQVFHNLLSNAIKYRGEHAPVINVSAEKADDEWIFSVKDNGIGIDPQYFSKLFVIFHRLHNRTEYDGNGIGLAICKKIVERHGGRIWIESSPGAGSEFKFTIPSEPEVNRHNNIASEKLSTVDATTGNHGGRIMKPSPSKIL
ncbi:MAG TPA: PAS domain S-box protein [Methanocella sp.]|nr:PAS domain S-box protein [Methanocella sp.]